MPQERRAVFRQFGAGRATDTKSDVILDDVRGHVWKKYGGRFDQLAETANLHLKTVEAFAWGDTKRPHFETIVRILVALGLFEALEKLLQIDTPITRDKARTR